VKPNRRNLLKLALSASGLGAAASTAVLSRDQPAYRRAGVAFDTGVALTVVSLDQRDAEAALDAGFAEIRRLEQVASLTRPGSDICRLNANGRLADPDQALLDMLAVAGEVHRATEGAFDVTLQPLWILYDAYAKRGEWPSDAQSAPARALIGQADVAFNRDEIAFARPGMAITLNSLTHGYAADCVARLFAERGVQHAFVDTGEMEALGHGAGGGPWKAGIQHPRQRDNLLGSLPVSGCIATAGDYQYYWSEDYSRNHILDPRSGASPASFACISVIAPTAVLADALSTAVCVVGRDKAVHLLRRFEAEAYGLTKDGSVWSSPGFPRDSLA
jgi:thiamine biosynthesis lipoprotein